MDCRVKPDDATRAAAMLSAIASFWLPGAPSFMDTRAALFREVGAPVSVERITLDPPAPTEVLVRVAAVGLCRTDYHVMRGPSAQK